MGGLTQDIRHALRSWTRSPGFALVALLTLVLAIGANTAIYSVVDAVLFEALPYRAANQLVMVTQRMPEIGWDRGPVSYPNWADWRASMRSTQDMAAFRPLAPATIAGDVEAEQVAGTLVTANLFSLLGAEAPTGRLLSEADAAADAPDVVVLSHTLWLSRYGGSPDVVGRTVRIDGLPREIVGVAPAGFEFPRPSDRFWVPTRASDEPNGDRDTHHLQVVARLRVDATLAEAQTELQILFDDMRAVYPQVFDENQPNVESLQSVVAGSATPMLVLLSGAVALLLAIACGNLANLMLIRGTSRNREMAVRSALGAGRARLIRQLVTESGVLALIGGAGGVLLAYAGTRLILALGPATLPRRNAIAVDGSALVFTLIVSLLCALVVGLVPAFRFSRARTHTDLHEGGRSTAGRRTGRLQAALVVAQLALALMLLASAGLLVRSYAHLATESPGFETEGVLSARISPAMEEYADFARLASLFDGLLERARMQPGVRAAGMTWSLPFGANWGSGSIVIEGSAPPPGEEPSVSMSPVTGDYFQAMGIPLEEGRLFTPEDAREGAPLVVVISRAMADRFWPGESAVGRRFKRGGADEAASLPWTTVVGVVGDVRRAGLDVAPEPEMYRVHAQAQWAREMFLVVHTDRDPLALVPPLRAELHALDAGVPLSDVRTMSQRVSQSVAEPRLRTFLVASFALLGGVLALVGIYGVIAFAVARRTREIGVRMAFGARRSTVVRHVFGGGARLIAIGLGLGLVGAIVAGRILATASTNVCPDASVPWPAACGVLYEVQPTDPLTWTAVVVGLLVSASLACLIPARRASRLDPMTTLRAD